MPSCYLPLPTLSIITGDFARKVDTFKETEATAGRIVRGRQVLFMLHDHFSASNHGATGKETFPWGHQFEVDETAASDAALAGTMLAGSVSNCLQGIQSKCAYLCDTDFGCNECTPKGITATPAECKDDVKGATNLNLDWIADTGSAQDLVNDRELPDDYGYYSDNPINSYDHRRWREFIIETRKSVRSKVGENY